MQRLPVGDGGVPQRTGRCEGTATEVLDRLVIDGDHARPGTSLDRHVAKGHATFERQPADRAAGKFDRVPCAPGRADHPDDVEDYVLGGTADGQRPLDADQHIFVFLGLQRLGGHDMLDFRSPDAESQGANGTVRRSMRIAANHRHSRQGCALLRADHVHDPLTQVVHAEFGHAVLVAIGVQGIDLKFRDRIRNAVDPVGRRHVVIRHRQVGVQTPELAPSELQTFKGLGACHFVQQMPIDVEDRGAIGFLANHMGVPKLVVQCFIHDAGFCLEMSVDTECMRQNRAGNRVLWEEQKIMP